MQGAPSKEVRDLAKKVKPYGWTWERHNGGHVKFLGPDGKMIVVSSTKSSDHRGMKNTISEFRRAGVPL